MSIIQNQRTVTQILQQERPTTLNYITEDHSHITEKYDNKFRQNAEFFHELDVIFEEREKYSLHWAFKNAAEKFNAKLVKFEKNSHSDKITTNITPTTLEDQELVDFTHSIKKQIKTASNRYRWWSKLTLGLDIVVSVLLILGVTLIAQHIERNLESLIFVTLFIAGIALTKVSLDRFWIIPTIDEWGWNKYHNLTHRIEEKTTRIIINKMTREFENQIQQDYTNPRWLRHFPY